MTIEENNTRAIAYQEHLRKQRENWTPEQRIEAIFKQQAENNKMLGKPNYWERWKGWQKNTDRE